MIGTLRNKKQLLDFFLSLEIQVKLKIECSQREKMMNWKIVSKIIQNAVERGKEGKIIKGK